MKTTESEDRFAPADLELIEEAADTVNLLALDLAIQAFERKPEGDFTAAEDISLAKMAERGMRMTGIMGRMVKRSAVM